jgi:hypothetical protein
MKPIEDYEQELLRLTNERQRLANKYAADRKAFGESKATLDILFAGSILSLAEKKKNIGYETGIIMLIAEKPEFQEDYKKMITHFNNYKAIEKMIDSVESRIMAIQSIMRYNRERDGGS